MQSEKSYVTYVGSTDDLERRLKEHNGGNVYSTRRNKPWKLIYYEAFLNRADASSREYRLKHHGSVIGHLKRRLKKSLNIEPCQKGGVQFRHRLTSVSDLRKSSRH